MSNGRLWKDLVGLRVVRVRLPELLDEYDITAYRLAQLVEWRYPNMYRLVHAKGHFKYLNAYLVEKLAEVVSDLKGKPVKLEEILELEGVPKPVKRKRSAGYTPKKKGK